MFITNISFFNIDINCYNIAVLQKANASPILPPRIKKKVLPYRIENIYIYNIYNILYIYNIYNIIYI